jgi:hypothetical protein
MLGPFVDDTDGKTAETGLSIAASDIRISKNGANIVAKNSGGGTHDELGYYTVTFNSTDTDTVGHLKVVCRMSGALVVEDEFWVLEEAIYDALYADGATGLLPANVTQFGGSNGTFDGGRPEVNATHWGGTAVAAANVLIDGAITAAKIANDAFSAAKFAAGAFDAVWSVAARLLTAGTNIVLEKGTGVTGFTDLDAAGVRDAVGLASANLDTQLGGLDGKIDIVDGVADAVKAKTDNLPADPADHSLVIAATDAILTAVGGVGTAVGNLNNLSAAAVNAEVDQALADYDGPTRAEATADKDEVLAAIAGIEGKVDIVDELVDTVHEISLRLETTLEEHDEYSWRFNTPALSQAPVPSVELTPEDIEAITGAITEALPDPWEQALPASYEAGTAGAILAGLPAAVAGVDGKIDIVDGVADAIKAKTDNLPADPADHSLVIAATDAILTAVGGVGTAVGNLNNLSAAAVNAEVDAALADYDGPTRAEATSDKDAVLAAIAGVDGKVDIVDGIADAIKAKTDNLPTDPADHSLVIAATDAILTAVGGVGTAIGGLNNLSAADVNAEVDQALADYDAPTRTEVTADKDAVLAAVAAAVAKVDIVDDVADAIKLKTDNLPASPAAASDVPSASTVAAAVLDLPNGIETGVTLRQAQRVQLAAAAGKTSGMATATATIRDINDSKNRIVAVTTEDGDRTDVTLNLD